MKKISALFLALLSLCGCGERPWLGAQRAEQAGRDGKTWEQFLADWPPCRPPTTEELRELKGWWEKGATHE